MIDTPEPRLEGPALNGSEDFEGCPYAHDCACPEGCCAEQEYADDDTCGTCGGSGGGGDAPLRCPACNGTGTRPDLDDGPDPDDDFDDDAMLDHPGFR